MPLCTIVKQMRLISADGNLRIYEPGQYYLSETLAWDGWCMAHFRNGKPEPPHVTMTDPGPPVTYGCHPGPVDDKLHAPTRGILAMPMRLPTLLDVDDGGSSPGEGRPDQRTAPRLVDVGPPSWRTRFVRWSNRAPRAKRGSVSFSLFVAVAF